MESIKTRFLIAVVHTISIDFVLPERFCFRRHMCRGRFSTKTTLFKQNYSIKMHVSEYNIQSNSKSTIEIEIYSSKVQGWVPLERRRRLQSIAIVVVVCNTVCVLVPTTIGFWIIHIELGEIGQKEDLHWIFLASSTRVAWFICWDGWNCAAALTVS